MKLVGTNSISRYQLVRATATALVLCFLAWSLFQLVQVVRQPQRQVHVPDALVSLDRLRESMARELERVALEGDFAEGGLAAASRLDRLINVYQAGVRGIDPALIAKAQEWMSVVPNARRELLSEMPEKRRRILEAQARANYGLALMEVHSAVAQLRRPSSENGGVERRSHIAGLILSCLFGLLLLAFLAIPIPKTEQSLLTTESWNKVAVERSADAILAVDGESIIKRCNPAAVRLLGYRRHEIVGQQLGTLIPSSVLHASDPMQVSAHRRDGSSITVRATTHPLAKDYRFAAIIVLREHKEDHSETEQLAEDFGQPITVINGYCDLLLESLPSDDPIREDLRAIRRAGSRAAALVSSLREEKADSVPAS